MRVQMRSNLSGLVVLAAVLSLAGSALNAQTVEYEVTILPPIPDSFATVVLGMNNHGDLVGYAQLPANPFYLRGWKWSAAEGMVMLPAPPGVNALRYAARDINDAGVIVGDGGGDSGEAWRLENGVDTLLGTMPGDPLSTGVSINESRDVVGFSGDLTPENDSRPYVRIMRFLDLKGRSDHGDETSHGGADHLEATGGGGSPGQGHEDAPGLPEARGHRADVLPLA